MFVCGYQCVEICVCATTEKQTNVNSLNKHYNRSGMEKSAETRASVYR